MKIIIQGKSKEEVERQKKIVRHFECQACGCVFEADNTEYYYHQCGYNETEFLCQCPNCTNTAHTIGYLSW